MGVILSGSVEIRKHGNSDLLNPYIVKKAIEGDIIGWADGDENYSSSPLSWIVALQGNTEIIFIDDNDWLKLWNI